MKTTKKTNLASQAKKIKLLLLDVDGVMTDGTIILDSAGKESKSFHVRDGHGIKLAQRAGIIVGLITGRSSKAVNVRAKELGIEEVYQGAREKILVYDELLEKYGLRDEQVAYIGDDVVDAAVLKRVGLAVTVSDCDPSVKAYVDLVTKTEGGRGAVREVINLILKHQDTSRAS